MTSEQPPRYEPGHPPHDPLNGLRAGGITGGVLGGLFMLMVTTTNPAPLIIGAVGGAAIGYINEKRKQPR